jgi:hypothetical protein
MGILVHHLKSFSGKHFLIHFTLWRQGGPDWGREFSKWETMQDAEWHVVKLSYASVASSPAVAPSAPRNGRSSAFHRISYLQNYYQSNFAHEFAKRDFQKESHSASGSHQKHCPRPEVTSQGHANSGDHRIDSRQVAHRARMMRGDKGAFFRIQTGLTLGRIQTSEILGRIQTES